VSDAFVKWCRSSTSGTAFLAMVDRFSAAGIALNNPSTRTAVLLDADGDQVTTTAAELASLIDRRFATTLTFEWWFSADEDLTCAYTFEPGKREVQTFYLDGLSLAEMATTSNLIQELFGERPDVADWLIIDTIGHSADFDWDNYLQYGDGDPSKAAPPDLIILSDTTLKARTGLPRPSLPNASGSGFVGITRGDWVR
jgi:hypothetical protein